MNYFLSIETALDVCSVALSNNDELLFLSEEKVDNIHSSKLTVFIDELLKEFNILPSDLSAIIVGKGPGSYTGLRIGVSVAKGLAFSLDKPLISVNTLLELAIIAKPFIADVNALLCPMIDARRMEVYTAMYDSDLKEFAPCSASIVNEDFISTLPRDRPLYFFGNGMQKCREQLSALPNAFFIDNVEPSALGLIVSGYSKYINSEFENVSSFEPFYLKDFFTTAKII